MSRTITYRIKCPDCLARIVVEIEGPTASDKAKHYAERIAEVEQWKDGKCLMHAVKP